MAEELSCRSGKLLGVLSSVGARTLGAADGSKLSGHPCVESCAVSLPDRQACVELLPAQWERTVVLPRSRPGQGRVGYICCGKGSLQRNLEP